MFKQFAAAALAISISTGALAGDKKSSSFLKASHDGQVGYISASLSMAQALLSKPQGECIGKWATAHQADGYKEVIDTIKKYDTYHPSSVIAAVIEKHCGSLELANR